VRKRGAQEVMKIYERYREDGSERVKNRLEGIISKRGR
jgi:hypothetical protein